jgi:hypothetical protein
MCAVRLVVGRLLPCVPSTSNRFLCCRNEHDGITNFRSSKPCKLHQLCTMTTWSPSCAKTATRRSAAPFSLHPSGHCASSSGRPGPNDPNFSVSQSLKLDKRFQFIDFQFPGKNKVYALLPQDPSQRMPFTGDGHDRLEYSRAKGVQAVPELNSVSRTRSPRACSSAARAPCCRAPAATSRQTKRSAALRHFSSNLRIYQGSLKGLVQPHQMLLVLQISLLPLQLIRLLPAT